VKIGIVCAMVKEVMPLLKKIGLPQEKKINGYPCYFLTKNGNDVIIIQSGYGEIYGSGATATLISLGAEQIYNFGVCGALTEELSSCDSVAVSGVVHYDFDLSAIDPVEPGVYPNQESAVIPTDKTLLKCVLEKFPNLKVGVCASGDKFIANENFKAELNKKFGATICDMESAGILLSSQVANVPCFMLKTVSDGKGGAQEYLKTVNTASEICANLILDIIG